MSTESFQPSEAVTTAPVTGDTTPPDAVDNGASDEAEPKTFTQEELNAIIAKEKAKERRRLERERAQQAEQPRASSTEAPRPDQFNTAEDYIEAVADWKAEQKITQREQQKRQNEVKTSYAEREESAREKYSDFQDVVYSDDLAISRVMMEAIIESDLGPEVAYHLGKNPREAERISGLSPVAQAREIGKIEASLASKSPDMKKPSSAPEPIKPVGTRASNPTYDTSDPRSTKTLSASEWINARNKKLRSQS